MTAHAVDEFPGSDIYEPWGGESVTIALEGMESKTYPVYRLRTARVAERRPLPGEPFVIHRGSSESEYWVARGWGGLGMSEYVDEIGRVTTRYCSSRYARDAGYSTVFDTAADAARAFARYQAGQFDCEDY